MLRRARIEKIIDKDTNNRYFTAIITWLDRDGGMYDEASFTARINLSYSYVSRSFGFQYYPVPGDVVLCGFCEEDQPVIISFLTTEYYSKITKNNAFHYYFRNIVEGEYAIKALQGNEIYFDRKGSLRFITRDQNVNYNNLQDIATKALNAQNYVKTLENGVDLNKQIADFPKTEVTIGKVYDEEYKEEQLLNDESIAIQIIGKKNTPNYDEKGNLKSVDVEETFKIQINVKGEISINTEQTINVKANIVEVDGSLQVKDETGSNSGVFTTYTGTTVTVENGIITNIVP